MGTKSIADALTDGDCAPEPLGSALPEMAAAAAHRGGGLPSIDRATDRPNDRPTDFPLPRTPLRPFMRVLARNSNSHRGSDATRRCS